MNPPRTGNRCGLLWATAAFLGCSSPQSDNVVARDAEAGFSDGAVDATSGSDVSTYADAMRGFDATSGDGGADASFRNEAGADATANAGVLRGVNLFGGWQGDYGGIDTFGPTTTLDYFRGKGLTTFRVGISWVDLQPTLNGPLSSSYLAMMDALVQNAKARGEGVAFVPLPGTYQGNDVGSSAVPIAALSNLWTQLASHYKNEPTIWGYDLLNEPNMGDSWNTTIAPQVIAAIRTVDTGHAIIVPTSTGGYGYNWANHTVGLPMSDPSNHLIYEAHFYFDTPPNGQYPDVNAVPSDVDAGAESAQAFVSWCIANHARCYAGEYGVPGGWTGGTELCTNGTPYTDPVWLTVLDNFLSYLDRNGILGTYWAGGPYGDVNDVGPTCAGVDRPQMAILEKHLGF